MGTQNLLVKTELCLRVLVFGHRYHGRAWQPAPTRNWDLDCAIDDFPDRMNIGTARGTCDFDQGCHQAIPPADGMT